MYFFHLGYPVDVGSVQEIAALQVYKKKRIIEVLKVVIDVQSMASGDKKELRKSCEAFLDETMPELKGLREVSEKKMAALIEEESGKVYSVQKSQLGRIMSQGSGRNKWRRR